ncbi:Histidine kinase [Sulfidibacter corallicola]|uniref:Histidine kinase n=1 Tax=Sulfidibacter corallicola TaxID=2818388 RepID=A0A8A4TIV2_SULCO|nr:histidine kinase [Sulfidibacter corallicola]QTD49533.1 histidine kinase [Sulfidibacter corallicola]
MLVWLWLLAAWDGTGLVPHRHDLDNSEFTSIDAWRFSDRGSVALAEGTADVAALPIVIAGEPLTEITHYWLVREVAVSGTPRSFDFLSIHVTGLVSAYEVYWDGALVLRNGVVGDAPDSEEPGRNRGDAMIPAEAGGPGIHLLAIRVSNHFRPIPAAVPVASLGYAGIREMLWVDSFYIRLINLGIFLLSALLSLALFWAGPGHRAYLLFAACCAAYIAEVLMTLFLQYGLPWPLARNALLLGRTLHPLAGFLLGAFFLYQYRVPYKRALLAWTFALHLLVLVPWAGLSPGWAYLLPLVFVLKAMQQREPGSFSSFLGVAVAASAMIFSRGEAFFAYSAAMILFVFCIVFGMTRRIAEQERRHERARLRSAHLETQLLKKVIQPHFLMNSLLSLISYIEEAPDRAVVMIRALSREFQIVNRIADAKTIYLAEEIDLCKAHLTVMAFRKDVDFAFEHPEPIPEIRIPPMIFHTLVENGVTHAFRPGEGGSFRLSHSREGARVRLRLCNDGSRLRGVDNADSSRTDGLGTRYVKSRLAECFPGRWELRAGLVAGVWCVDIEFEVHERDS